MCVWALAATWAALVNGSVNDEFAAHIPGGYLYLTTGRFAGGVHNPPLGQVWVALPPVLLGQPLVPFTDDPPVASRLANIVLGVVLLVGLGEYLRRLQGETAACLGIATLVATPEFTAHGSLATIDLPVTAAILGATLSYAEMLRRPTWKTVLATGLFLGGAIATKISGFLLFPIFSGMTLVFALWLRPRFRPRPAVTIWQGWKRVSIACVFMSLLAYAVVWACYAFRFAQGSHSIIFAHDNLLRFFFPAEFVDQLLGKASYAKEGNLAYFGGRSREGGWWWYYPAVLVLKTPLPVLCLWALSAVWAFRVRKSRPPMLMAAALTFLFVASLNRAQIGVRHLLPVVPLFAVGTGLLAQVPLLWLRRFVWWLSAAALVNWAMFLPYPLTAESLFLGGNGYRYFADSNYDWGQANKAVRELVAQGHCRRPWPYAATTGTLVIRVNEWAGHRSLTQQGFAWLRTMRPVARIARAGLVFEPDNRVFLNAPKTESLATNFAIDWARARTIGADCTCSACFDSFMMMPPLLQNEVAGPWLHNVEHTCGVNEAYRLARRLALLCPADMAVKDYRDRLGLIIEAQRLGRRERGKSAYAWASAAWLAGNPSEVLRWLGEAIEYGTPREACAYLGYRSEAALGRWRGALTWADQLPPERRNTLMPPLEVLWRFASGRESAEDCYELGMFWYKQQLWQPAASMFMHALERDPSHALAFAMLGELVVRYKEEKLGLEGDQRDLLEKLVIWPQKARLW
ncbi:MAG: glycosyltransferase family 39 protein [Candidatus Sumerlaeaceae bacterium]